MVIDHWSMVSWYFQVHFWVGIFISQSHISWVCIYKVLYSGTHRSDQGYMGQIKIKWKSFSLHPGWIEILWLPSSHTNMIVLLQLNDALQTWNMETWNMEMSSFTFPTIWGVLSQVFGKQTFAITWLCICKRLKKLAQRWLGACQQAINPKYLW